MKILAATRNPGKLRELKSLLAELPIEIVTLDDIPGMPEVIEDGETFEENAAKKASELARESGLIALAEDSGLEVGALDGAPGVYSARYAGESRSHSANNRKLLSELKNVPKGKRTARFVCVAAVASPEKILFTARGVCDGLILEKPRGESGFGYDPLFFYPPKNQTFAEMGTEEKNKVSHRAKALADVKVEFEKILKSNDEIFS
ncbi:MAG: XTP/dITP diphosphatase [Planctomycetota bacterium]|nr:MAG: XTP/dITP diphosphatase [Planctomycetota bacterium]